MSLVNFTCPKCKKEYEMDVLDFKNPPNIKCECNYCFIDEEDNATNSIVLKFNQPTPKGEN